MVHFRCHEITKLLDEWRDGDESALEKLMEMLFKRAQFAATRNTPQLDRLVKTAAGQCLPVGTEWH